MGWCVERGRGRGGGKDGVERTPGWGERAGPLLSLRGHEAAILRGRALASEHAAPEAGESSSSRLTAPEPPRPEPLPSPENLSLPGGAAPAGEDGTGRSVETAWREGRR